jgi:hypothetical protein
MMLELFIIALMSVAPNSRVMKDKGYRTKITEAVEEASETFDIDKFELAGVFYFESSFDYTAESKSKLKEYGLGQVHGRAKNACSKNGYSLHNIKGQVMCTAYLLNKLKKDCGGSSTRGMYKYMSGKCKGTPRAKRMLRYRRNKLRKVKRKCQK